MHFLPLHKGDMVIKSNFAIFCKSFKHKHVEPYCDSDISWKFIIYPQNLSHAVHLVGSISTLKKFCELDFREIKPCWISDLLQWSSSLRALRKRLEEVTGIKFNSMLANMYRDGHDSVAWHADDESSLGPEPSIASLSFGDTRNFELRKKPPPVSSVYSYNPLRRRRGILLCTCWFVGQLVCALSHLLQWITREHFASEASKLAVRSCLMSTSSLLIIRSVGQRSRWKDKPSLICLEKGGIVIYKCLITFMLHALSWATSLSIRLCNCLSGSHTFW